MPRLSVPCSLEYRDLAMRFVAAACRIAHERARSGRGAAPDALFDDHVLSAVGEAFNNAVLHGDGEVSEVQLSVRLSGDQLTVKLVDHGPSFDFAAVPPPHLEELPESGMGLFIIRACMDDVRYEAGPPNVLAMTRRFRSGDTAR